MTDGATNRAAATPDEDDGTRPRRLPINVSDLRTRLGQRRTEAIEIALGPQTVVASRTTAEPVVGEIVVESIERGVSAFGSVRFGWEGDCRRCLEVTGGHLDIDIAEIFQVDAPEDSEIIDFDGVQIDLVPVVRDAVVLSLPLAPLCSEDCAGPDPDRYPAVTEEEREQRRAEEAASTPDPRWAALEGLDLSTEDESG